MAETQGQSGQDWFATNAPTAPTAPTVSPQMPPTPSVAPGHEPVPSPAPPTPPVVTKPTPKPTTPSHDWFAANAPAPTSMPAVTTGATLSPITSADLTSNPKGEGTYKMIGSDGKPIQIPYSKIRGYDDPYSKSAQNFQAVSNLGYHFADEGEQRRFLKDLAADPVYGNQGYGNGLVGWLHAGGSDLTVGALREGAKDIVGLTSIANKLANKINPGLSSHLPGFLQENDLDRRIKTFAGTDARTAKEKIGGLLENVAEIVVPEAKLGEVAGATKAGQAAKAAIKTATEVSPAAATAAKIAGHAALAGAEQGTQQYIKSGGDIDQAKQAAEAGALAGGATVAATSLIPATSQFLKNTLRHRMGVDEFETEKLVQATQAANEKIDAQAAKVVADNDAAVAKYQKNLSDLQAKHAKELADLKTDKLTALQKDQEAEAEAQLASAQEKAIRTRAEAVEAKRDNLTLAAQRARAEVQQRLQTIQQSARQYFSQAYGDLEKAAGSKGVSYATLADGVHEALDKVKGSAESTKVFKDILARTRGIEEAQQAAGYELEDLANLAPDERERLLAHLGEEGNPAAAGASLAHLNGYYSELGRALSSPSTPGDVKQAIGSLRDFIDKQVKQELGPELYAKNQLVRSQYRRYAEGWKEYGGVAGSGSPVAMALQAKDPYNATRPFIGMAKEEADRARGIIVGAPGDPAERFTQGKIPESYAKSEAVEQQTLSEVGERIAKFVNPKSWDKQSIPLNQFFPVDLHGAQTALTKLNQLAEHQGKSVASLIDEAPLVEVPRGGITATQENAKVPQVLASVRNALNSAVGVTGTSSDKYPVLFLKDGDRYYVSDGHNRIVGDLAAGRPISGKVVDVNGELIRLPQVAIPTTSTSPSLVPVGSLTPSWRYRKQTAQLIEHLRNLEGGLDALPKSGSFDSAISKASTARETALNKSAEASLETGRASRALANAPAPPTPPPAPAPEVAPPAQTLTPDQLRQAKVDALHAAAHNLGKFGLWVGIGGLAGGVGTFLKTGDFKKSAEIAAGGMAAGLLTPYLAAKMLDQPGVVKSLTTLSRKDLDQLMKLPPTERGDVEGAIRQLADEAVRSGRVKAAQVPWYRVIGGEAGRGMARGNPAASGTGAPAAPSAPSAPLPPGQNLPTPTLANPDQIDQNITGASPNTHTFSLSKWRVANPGRSSDAAVVQAKHLGFQVVP